MARAFTSVHPPLKMRVEETPLKPGWHIFVQFLRLPPNRITLYEADEESAKKTAIAIAHAMCEQHKIDTLPCLENPQWQPDD